MAEEKITKAQRSLLFALWRLYAVDEDNRGRRLAWASKNLGRQLDSFNDLTKQEARSLADVLQIGLGPIPELPEDFPSL